jgi:hypothetical protein
VALFPPRSLRVAAKKGHARRCKAWPGGGPGCVLRLAHGLFDPQRILEKSCEQALVAPNITDKIVSIEAIR